MSLIAFIVCIEYNSVVPYLLELDNNKKSDIQQKHWYIDNGW